MNVYTCTDFPGYYVGTASVVVARSITAARRILRAALLQRGLIPADFDEHRLTLEKVDRRAERVIILLDGDY